MSEKQKEYEAMQLVNLMDKMQRQRITEARGRQSIYCIWWIHHQMRDSLALSKSQFWLGQNIFHDTQSNLTVAFPLGGLYWVIYFSFKIFLTDSKTADPKNTSEKINVAVLYQIEKALRTHARTYRNINKDLKKRCLPALCGLMMSWLRLSMTSFATSIWPRWRRWGRRPRVALGTTKPCQRGCGRGEDSMDPSHFVNPWLSKSQVVKQNSQSIFEGFLKTQAMINLKKLLNTS